MRRDDIDSLRQHLKAMVEFDWVFPEGEDRLLEWLGEHGEELLDRVEILEVFLEQAAAKIEFLHGCLTNPHVDGVPGGSTYAYPHMTGDFLAETALLINRHVYCVHSHVDPDCASCVDGDRARAVKWRWRESLKDTGVEKAGRSR